MKKNYKFSNLFEEYFTPSFKVNSGFDQRLFTALHVYEARAGNAFSAGKTVFFRSGNTLALMYDFMMRLPTIHSVSYISNLYEDLKFKAV